MQPKSNPDPNRIESKSNQAESNQKQTESKSKSSQIQIKARQIQIQNPKSKSKSKSRSKSEPNPESNKILNREIQEILGSRTSFVVPGSQAGTSFPGLAQDSPDRATALSGGSHAMPVPEAQG